jgi:hypothetical protein
VTDGFDIGRFHRELERLLCTHDRRDELERLTEQGWQYAFMADEQLVTAHLLSPPDAEPDAILVGSFPTSPGHPSQN